jgi:hypothetical protein
MNFGTVKGVVYLRGVYQLSRVYTQSEDEKTDEESKVREFTIKTLSSLEMKIRSVPGVSEVIFQFLNWKKERGHWIPAEGKKKEGEEDEEKKDPNRSEDLKGG